MRPVFHGTAGSMFPIVFKGLLLTVLTLGIYRFWYITNVRKFLWNNSEVDGDYAEYTGRGVELFIGFLIALAVLIPFYGALVFAGFVAGPIAAAILNAVGTWAIIFLAQYALFRARRYRLTRTIWRGIRFQQSGSGWAYAGMSFGWVLLTLLTLGLAYPWMRASLERYKMKHTWYGDQQGAFASTGGHLFKRFIWLWLLVVLLIVGSGLGIGAASGLAEAEGVKVSPVHWAISSLITIGGLILVVLVPVYWAIEFKWWANGCSVGPAAAQCDLGAFAFFKVYLGYIGVVLLFSLIIGAVLLAVGASLWGAGVLEAREPGPAKYAVMAAMVLAYFVVALVFAALWQLFGVRPIWRKSLEGVEIVGLAALMAAQSQEPAANAFGEGVADALDFGGF